MPEKYPLYPIPAAGPARADWSLEGADPMPPSPNAIRDAAVEFSVEDAMLNTWVEDTDVYLSLEPQERERAKAEPPGEQS